jgi:hypothetical protein
MSAPNPDGRAPDGNGPAYETTPFGRRRVARAAPLLRLASHISRPFAYLYRRFRRARADGAKPKPQ